MEQTTLPDYERGLTFEKVWASIQELKAENDRRSEENDRQSRELREENDRLIKEFREFQKKSQEETALRLKENSLEMKESSRLLDKKLSALGNRFGEMIEYLASPGLKEKFKAFGFDLAEFCHDKEFWTGKQIIAEADVFLESSDMAMVVEMKSKPDIDDVKDHIERMDKLRKYADAKGDTRKYFGALGGMVWGENERNYALKSGLYVIEPSGNTFDVIAPMGDCKPREW